MNDSTMRYVIAVYEEKSMTRAARKLFIAQPTLSQSIRVLEADLGTKLFDRSKTPLAVTEAGEIFVQWARHILLSELRMRKHLLDLSTDRLRKLVVGISPQICKEILPTVLQQFYAVTSGCSVVLKDYGSSELKLLLEGDSIDFLIDRPHAGYNCVPIVEEMVLLAAPASYRFSPVRPGEYPSVNIADLEDMPFIFLSDNEFFKSAVSDIFRQIGGNPSIVLECSNLQEAHSMVSHDIGVTLIPESCAHKNKLPNVCYYTLHGHPLSHVMTALYRRDRTLTEDAVQFLSLLRDTYTVYTSRKSADGEKEGNI
jgi:DNA-binding transcriptional LysR family regulator